MNPWKRRCICPHQTQTPTLLLPHLSDVVGFYLGLQVCGRMLCHSDYGAELGRFLNFTPATMSRLTRFHPDPTNMVSETKEDLFEYVFRICESLSSNPWQQQEEVQKIVFYLYAFNRSDVTAERMNIPGYTRIPLPTVITLQLKAAAVNASLCGVINNYDLMPWVARHCTDVWFQCCVDEEFVDGFRTPKKKISYTVAQESLRILKRAVDLEDLPPLELSKFKAYLQSCNEVATAETQLNLFNCCDNWDLILLA